MLIKHKILVEGGGGMIECYAFGGHKHNDMARRTREASKKNMLAHRVVIEHRVFVEGGDMV